MKAILATVLCVVGTAACAHNTPAQDASNAAVPQTSSQTASTANPGASSAPPADTTTAMAPPTPTPSTGIGPNPTTGSPTDTGPTGGSSMAGSQPPGQTGSGMGSTSAQGSDTSASPATQGTSKPELAITAAIHKSVERDASLSLMAKRVKIITAGTKVTLRGTVRSDTERSTIESLARQTSGVTDVDDQIQVKAQ